MTEIINIEEQKTRSPQVYLEGKFENRWKKTENR